jgi:hypothetical protein
MASCCGHTLEWNRRAGEAAQQNGNILKGKPGGRNTSRSGSRNTWNKRRGGRAQSIRLYDHQTSSKLRLTT